MMAHTIAVHLKKITRTTQKKSQSWLAVSRLPLSVRVFLNDSAQSAAQHRFSCLISDSVFSVLTLLGKEEDEEEEEERSCQHISITKYIHLTENRGGGRCHSLASVGCRQLFAPAAPVFVARRRQI